MTKKSIKKKRMLCYYIEATQHIIEEEGIENLSIRKISAKAGYNSATLYNYFEDLEQLICYSLISCVMKYFISLNKLFDIKNKSYITFLLTWREYAVFSFQKPKIYTQVFYSKDSDNILKHINPYLEFFPNHDFNENSESYKRILGNSIEERNKLIFDPCVKDGYMDSLSYEYIFNFCYALHLGMCQQIINNKYSSPEEATNIFLEYLIDFLLTNSKINVKKYELLEEILSISIGNATNI